MNSSKDFEAYKRITETKQNKARYTAQDAPSTRLKITGDGRTDGRTDGHTLRGCDGTSRKESATDGMKIRR